MHPNNLPKLKGFLPKQQRELYPSIGMCIYCGSKDNLTDEHIIPFGLGGNLIIKKASCPDCAKVTGDFEQTCLRAMYGPLRLLYDLPTRRPEKRPIELPLKVKYRHDETEWQTMFVDQKKYPFLVTFPYFEAPGILSKDPIGKSEGPVTKRLWIRGASPYYSFRELLDKLLFELKVDSICPESKAEIPAFCRMISKIAHAFAVAKIGLANFTPVLNPIIIKNNVSHCMYYLGSINKNEAPESDLHKLEILEFNNIDVIFVTVRLLCKLGTPTYIVAVGTRK